MKSLTFVKAVAALALLSTSAPAALVNGNFDADVLPDGGFTCSGTIGFTGWNSLGGGCGTGLHNPTASQYPGGIVPSGNNVAYHNGISAFWQNTSEVYTAGVTYTFSIQVGHRLDETFSGYQVELRSGSGYGAPLVGLSSSSSPGAGQFKSVSISYTPTAGDAVLGKNVVVFFLGGAAAGTQTSFDNATLTTATPEPATYALVGSALIGLSMWRRKRVAA